MNGHHVSAYLRENLPYTLNNEIRNKKKLSIDGNISLNKIIEDVFLYTNSKIFNESSFDTKFSGSTCVSVIYTPEKVICANVGDSRAVIGRCINGGNRDFILILVWSAHNVSRDHKPSDKDESIRITRKGGRIEPYKEDNGDFVGPARVWLKNEDIPGLAMSRSFGDEVAASVGVLAEPEIMEWDFTAEDKFMILASDGVWEFIESDEVNKQLFIFF